MSNKEKSSKKKLLPAYFVSELIGHYDEREARSIARMVLEDLTGMEAMKVLTGEDEKWQEPEINKLDNILNRLKAGDPIQYILGYTYFYDLRLDLSSAVLIPRNETEELVDWLISECKNEGRGCRILDIGCGSGAISIAIAKNLPQADVYAVDISKAAIETCSHNARKNSVKLSCSIMDILNPLGEMANQKYDIIVSNPPYVLESQRPFMEKRVSDQEPGIALFVPDMDPFLFYRAVSDFGSKNLKPNGKIYVEINDRLANETIREFDRHFPNTELRQDIHGKDRMIKAAYGKE